MIVDRGPLVGRVAGGDDIGNQLGERLRLPAEAFDLAHSGELAGGGVGEQAHGVRVAECEEMQVSYMSRESTSASPSRVWQISQLSPSASI